MTSGRRPPNRPGPWWRGRQPTAVVRDDAGVIAIIVALSISTFLLGFAALAVDLGMAYERQTALQSVADRLALAGAQGLPSVGTALIDVQNALTALCADNSDAGTTPGICRPAPPEGWMQDGNLANGEVRFYADTGQSDIMPTSAGDFLPYSTTQAEGIRVVLPPSKVTFGFAGAFTNGSVLVRKSATARIGTALGAGILPFALSSTNLQRGRWCVVTGVPITHSGPPSATPDPCARSQRTVLSRSYDQLARASNNAGSDALASNIRTGPQVRLYPGDGLLGTTLGQALDCVSAIFSPATTCLSSAIGQNFAQDLTDGLFSAAGNAPGRLDHDCGQGTSSVPGESGMSQDDSQLLSGSAPAATSLVDTSQTSPQALLSNILSPLHPPVTSAQQGWVSSRALQCGRLAVMPVIEPFSLDGLVAGQTIVSFTYVWIDDIADGEPTADRGVTWTDGQVSSMQGYVINPLYLPGEVAGSPVVGPYLGADMPTEALLVHDLDAPAT